MSGLRWPVVERCSLVCIQASDGHGLILAHADAIELTLALVEALFNQRRRGEGAGQRKL
jgi:hypothetical protein